MLTHPEIDISEPLLDWHPGDPTPYFPALAWLTQSRWTSPPTRNMLATATKKAKQLMGGAVGGRPIRIREATHDCHVSALYLHFREHFPELAARWVPEDAFDSDEHRDKRPDAIITGPEPIFIEFGGAYPAARIRERWEFAQEKGCRFQLY